MESFDREQWEEEARMHHQPQRSGETRFTTVSGSRSSCCTPPKTSPASNYHADIGYPGSIPYTRGIHPTDVPGQALDDAAVRGLRHAGGHERALPLPARATARPDSPSRSIFRR